MPAEAPSGLRSKFTRKWAHPKNGRTQGSDLGDGSAWLGFGARLISVLVGRCGRAWPGWWTNGITSSANIGAGRRMYGPTPSPERPLCVDARATPAPQAGLPVPMAHGRAILGSFPTDLRSAAMSGSERRMAPNSTQISGHHRAEVCRFRPSFAGIRLCPPLLAQFAPRHGRD